MIPNFSCRLSHCYFLKTLLFLQSTHYTEHTKISTHRQLQKVTKFQLSKGLLSILFFPTMLLILIDFQHGKPETLRSA